MTTGGDWWRLVAIGGDLRGSHIRVRDVQGPEHGGDDCERFTHACCIWLLRRVVAYGFMETWEGGDVEMWRCGHYEQKG